MTPTPRDLELAYRIWARSVTCADVDETLRPFLNLDTHTSWLRLARTALRISSTDIARRMETSSQSYLAIEKREADLTISLQQLARAAEAMDCELVYAIRPKSRRLFSEVIWEKVLKEVLPLVSRRPHLPHMRGHVIAALAIEAIRSPKTLKKLGLSRQWSRQSLAFLRDSHSSR